MLQDFMWNTFERTGNIDAYLAYKQISNIVVNQAQSINNENELNKEMLSEGV